MLVLPVRFPILPKCLPKSFVFSDRVRLRLVYTYIHSFVFSDRVRLLSEDVYIYIYIYIHTHLACLPNRASRRSPRLGKPPDLIGRRVLCSFSFLSNSFSFFALFVRFLFLEQHFIILKRSFSLFLFLCILFLQEFFFRYFLNSTICYIFRILF